MTRPLLPAALALFVFATSAFAQADERIGTADSVAA